MHWSGTVPCHSMPLPLLAVPHCLTYTPCQWQGADTAPRCPMPLLLAEAPRFESIMEDIDAQEGETPRFAVVVEGKPLPDIMWYKVGWEPPTPS